MCLIYLYFYCRNHRNSISFLKHPSNLIPVFLPLSVCGAEGLPSRARRQRCLPLLQQTGVRDGEAERRRLLLPPRVLPLWRLQQYPPPGRSHLRLVGGWVGRVDVVRPIINYKLNLLSYLGLFTRFFLFYCTHFNAFIAMCIKAIWFSLRLLFSKVLLQDALCPAPFRHSHGGVQKENGKEHCWCHWQ